MKFIYFSLLKDIFLYSSNKPWPMPTLTEHSITLNLQLPEKDVHKKMEVFYNPLMASHRNIAVLLLNSVANENMNIADPLAGSGIRSLRFLKELKKGKISHLFVNDAKENFRMVFKKNLALNKISTKNISVFSEDASLFLLNRIKDRKKPKHFCGYFDYIDLDPFGSPNPFLDAAIARICRNGVLAITATDTAALTGTYEKVTRRKYWAQPLRNYLMHEIGLRILIRKVQLQGVQFDKALIPILSYAKDHYYRAYFRNEKGKAACDKVLKEHAFFLFCARCGNFATSASNSSKCKCGNKFLSAGPLWTGALHDRKLLQTMLKNNPFPEEQKFLEVLREESKAEMVGFYDLHVLAKKYKKEPPRMEIALKKLKGVRTHFSGTAIKSTLPVHEVIKRLYP